MESELFIDVTVPLFGPNPEIWARHILKNRKKYDRFVRPRVEEFQRRQRAAGIEGEVCVVHPSVLDVKREGYDAQVTLRYYYIQDKVEDEAEHAP